LNIRDNILLVKERIAAAACRSGRDPDDITLLAVTKNVSVDLIKQVYDCGFKEFGENRVQELQKKIALLPDDAVWHMIGHLQTNKIKYIIDKIGLIHSLDSLSLAREINRQALLQNMKVQVLLEINISGEQSKFGIPLSEAREFVKLVNCLPGLTVRGLMTMAPYTTYPEEVRPIFRGLKDLSERISRESSEINMDVLSMGMSNDFEVAVEEGATIVRVGTALFGV
jgi:pyridoxal phosphate enzyme (YggS family)